MFYYVFRIQNTVDGSAFFGIKQTADIGWGEGGNFWQLGIKPGTKKFQERVQKYGMKAWRLSIYTCTTELELANRELNKILDQTKGHPLCLNYDVEAHNAARVENLALGKEAARIANQEPKPAEQKKKISKAMKKFKEKQAAEAAAAGTTVPAPNADMRWIHNKSTKEEMMIYNDEDLITDFEEGRLPKA